MNWLEVADGVFACRCAELDLTVGLVLGERACLVVDTTGDAEQGRELAAGVRRRTGLPCLVVLTHGHFDHCFGTSALDPAQVWAHPGCTAHLARTAGVQRANWVRWYRERGDAARADALAAAPLVPADRHVAGHAELDLGGRTVRLRHLGRGHTDHDLVVHLPDARVLFAGDLIEQGAPPDFEDAWPLDWPATLTELLALRPTTVLPGHGGPVDAKFVAAQRAELAEFAGLATGVLAGELDHAEAARRSPFPETVTTTALARLR